jgi:ABC-2 type transport system ATP-binding protein
MSELEDTADHLVVIGRGRLLADSSVADLLAGGADGRVTVRTSDNRTAMAALVRAGARVSANGGDGMSVSGLAPDHIATVLVGQSVSVLELTPHRPSLEDAYVRLTRGAAEFSAGNAGADSTDPTDTTADTTGDTR